MRISLLATMAVAFALQAPPSAMAEGRDNPFTVPPTKAEEQARQDERVRRIVREMSPEIQSRVMQEVVADRKQAEADVNRRLDDVAEKLKAAPAPAMVATVPTAPGNGSPIPGQKGQTQQNGQPGAGDGSKFISCVNGKALYRDKDNTLFQVSGIGPSGVDRCAR